MQVVDVEDATSNLVYDLGRILLGGECFDGNFASDDGNEIRDRVQLWEAVDGQRKLVKAVLIPTRSVVDGFKFW